MNKMRLIVTISLLVISLSLTASVTSREVMPEHFLAAWELNASSHTLKPFLEPVYSFLTQRRQCNENSEHIETQFAGTEVSGILDFPDEGLTNAEAHLSIREEKVGNETLQKFTFRLTKDMTRSGQSCISGWLSVRTTCGYTGVTIMLEPNGGNGCSVSKRIIISLTACNFPGRSAGSRFELSSLPSSPTFKFSSLMSPAGSPTKWGSCKIR